MKQLALSILRVSFEIFLTIILVIAIIGFVILFVYNPFLGIGLVIAYFGISAIYNDYRKRKDVEKMKQHYEYWANKDKYP